MLKYIALALALAACGTDTTVESQALTSTVTKLHDFTHDEGYQVQDSFVVGPDDALYETGWKGGTGAYDCSTSTTQKTCYCGTVQRFDPSSSSLSIVHQFSGLDSTGRNLDGCAPTAPVSFHNGRMWTVTTFGGTGGNPIRPANGEIASMLLDGSDVRSEWMFGQPRPGGGFIDGGGNPQGGLVWNDPACPGGDVAYGAVPAGIYVFNPSAHTVVLKYGWPARASNGTNTTGTQSYGSPVLTPAPDCKLVGIDYYGGANTHGAIYQVDPNGPVNASGYWTSAVALYSLPAYSLTGNNTDNTPRGSPIVDASGSVYVAVSYGMTNGTGGLLKVERTATSLHEYGVWVPTHGWTAGGAIPLGTPTLGADGRVYVTTFYGDNSYGTLGRVDKDGRNYVDLYSFLLSSTNPDTNMCWPYAGLVAVGSTFYGTTGLCGSFGGGTIFSFTVSE